MKTEEADTATGAGQSGWPLAPSRSEELLSFENLLNVFVILRINLGGRKYLPSPTCHNCSANIKRTEDTLLLSEVFSVTKTPKESSEVAR